MIGEPNDTGEQSLQVDQDPASEVQDPANEQIEGETGWTDETELLAPVVVNFIKTRSGEFGGDMDVSGLDTFYHDDLRDGIVREVLVYRDNSEIQRIKVSFINSRTEVFIFGAALQAFLESPTE